MTLPEPTQITLGDPLEADKIVLSAYDVGDGPAVVFCHGFPDTAFGWRRQLTAVADAGFRAIAPDQRGCGASSAPHDVEAYGLRELTGDLVRLLDAKGIDDAVFVGHDWGGFVVWAMAVLHPDRVRGVAGLCTPYMPFPMVADHLAIVDGVAERQYVAWFQADGVAEAVMDANVEPILTRIFRSGTPLAEQAEFAFADGKLNMNPFSDPTAWPILGTTLVDEAELAHYVAGVEHSGFRGGINWYRNIDRNAAELPDVGRRQLDIPCLMFTAEFDPGLRPSFADGMSDVVADLTRHDLLGVGHWIQQEVPDQVNGHLIDWLQARFLDV
jgi:pimeloyl-ACP methyl ester carboxylesterase